MPVFLVSRYATKPDIPNGITVQHHSAGIIEALNADDAEGKGMDGLHRDKPMSEDWTGHDVAVAQLSHDILRVWATKA